MHTYLPKRCTRNTLVYPCILVGHGTESQSHRLSSALKSPTQSQTLVRRSGKAQVTWSCYVQCQVTVSRAAGASSDYAVMPALLAKDRNFPDKPILPAHPAKTHAAQCQVLCCAPALQQLPVELIYCLIKSRAGSACAFTHCSLPVQPNNDPSVPPQLWYTVIFWDHFPQNSFKLTIKVTLRANKHECRSYLSQQSFYIDLTKSGILKIQIKQIKWNFAVGGNSLLSERVQVKFNTSKHYQLIEL